MAAWLLCIFLWSFSRMSLLFFRNFLRLCSLLWLEGGREEAEEEGVLP